MKRNPVAKTLSNPKYRKRVVKDKTKYKRLRDYIDESEEEYLKIKRLKEYWNEYGGL
jgi:hypothetical protein